MQSGSYLVRDLRERRASASAEALWHKIEIYNLTGRPAMNGKPASGHMARCGQSPAQPLGVETSKAWLRIFACNFCSTAEVVPWCGQNPNCGHPECAEALARCAAPHRLDDRLFHGQVNVAIVERHLWDRDKVAAAAH